MIDNLIYKRNIVVTRNKILIQVYNSNGLLIREIDSRAWVNGVILKIEIYKFNNAFKFEFYFNKVHLFSDICEYVVIDGFNVVKEV